MSFLLFLLFVDILIHLDLDKCETVQNMQRVCTRLLNSGLSTLFCSVTPQQLLTTAILGTIAKRHNIRINYTNFDIAMKEKLAIDLKGCLRVCHSSPPPV